MIDDVRFAVRALLKAPVFAVVVIVTVALRVGANTAVSVSSTADAGAE